jgi:hypothetical protein
VEDDGKLILTYFNVFDDVFRYEYDRALKKTEFSGLKDLNRMRIEQIERNVE